jgi:hypothetical protein
LHEAQLGEAGVKKLDSNSGIEKCIADKEEPHGVCEAP